MSELKIIKNKQLPLQVMRDNDYNHYIEHRLVAEQFGIEPESLVKLIKKYKKVLEEDFGKLGFQILPSGTKTNQNIHIYFLNLQHVLFLSAITRTNDDNIQIKMDVIKCAFQMANDINKNHIERIKGKVVRRELTDELQILIGYAIAQGSQNSHHLYCNYTKLVYAILEIDKDRDDKTPQQLADISEMEWLFSEIIKKETNKLTHYKDIYTICKTKGEMFYNALLEQRNKKLALSFI